MWAAQWGQREEGVASLLVMPQAGVAQHCPRQPSPVRGEGTQPAGEHVRSVWGSRQLSARDPHESATSRDHAQDQDVALAGPSTPPRDLALARGLVLEDGVCGCAGVVAVDE